MCLINGRCRFIKALHYIWNWKATAAYAILHHWGCQGFINQTNLRPSLTWSEFNNISSCCQSVSTATFTNQIFCLTCHRLWSISAVWSLLFLLWLVCSETPTTSCLQVSPSNSVCVERGKLYLMCPLEKSYCLLTNRTHTRTCTNSQRHTCLSL